MRALLISGPSTVGKSRVIRELKKNEIMQPVISCTTRKCRQDEREGVDYYFMTEKEFLHKKEQFIFWKKNDYGYYGTLKSEFEKIRESEKIPVLDIDYDIAFEMKEKYPDSISVFLLPESLEIIRERILSRGKERGITSQEEADIRYKNAVRMIPYCKYYDYLIQNDDAKATAHDICCIMRTEQIKSMRPSYIKKWQL